MNKFSFGESKLILSNMLKYAINGVNLTFQDLLRQDARIQDLYFSISETKLSITSLYIISYAISMTLFEQKTAM